MSEPLDASRLFVPAERVLPTMLRRQAERHGDKPLVRIGQRVWTFAEAPDLAARAAARLHETGIGAGDRVALICGNRAEFVEILLGCGWLGAVLVPINTASRGAQLRHMLTNSGARLLIVEVELVGSLSHVDLATLPVETVWLIGAPHDPRALPPLPSIAIAPAPLGSGDPFAILYTSGTTGPSKGVICPHAQYFWWGLNTAHLLGVVEGDVLCTSLPLFHTNALNTLFQALLVGATAVYEPRFSASDFWHSLKRHDATVTYLLGAMVPILLARPADTAERAHRVRVALAPGVPAQFHAAFAARSGIGLIDGYGSTETNFVIGTSLAEQRPGSMGRVFEGFNARVVDDADNELPYGTPGELIVRADAPFAFATGYFGAPEKTVEASRNLWFHTGDRVIREPDGHFKFVDRMKDAIRRRGENISSYEVEQVLLSHPDVATAAVFPVASELAEDEVMCAIVKKSGSTLGEVELIRHCVPLLPYFAVPRFVEFVEALPATENGKIQKYKLRERGVQKTTWDREAAGIVIARR
jgi:crotonobetaine/carnitine-CoA ligase